jgi:hypothetical protein
MLSRIVHQSKEREKQALLWLESLRRESDALAATQESITHELGRLSSSDRQLHHSTTLLLSRWTEQFQQLRSEIDHGSKVFKGQSGPRATIGPRMITEPTTENPAEPTDATDAPIEMVDSQDKLEPWAIRLFEEKLADEEVVRFLADSRRRAGLSLEQALIAHGVVTAFQIACVKENRLNDLKIGSVQILDCLHQGRLAMTYLCRLQGYGKALVLRLLTSSITNSPAMSKAYEASMSAAMAFRHPNVVAIHALFQHQGRIGLLMDNALGKPLNHAIVRLDPMAVINTFHQALGVLWAAQRGGFTHRNLRPSRLLISDVGRLTMLGFGEPGWLSNLHRCECRGLSDYYLAPELSRPDTPVDSRADLFSLARCYGEAIMGRRLADQESLVLPKGYPPEFQRILARCMDPDRDRRCRSILEIAMLVSRLGIRVRPVPIVIPSYSTTPSDRAAA